ncbi:MAG: histidine ammonia-lyase [Candidatus Eremiobacteraeota bacterium]|nr:histidine ammonia-lyase [Candidatus Eremiobacteraeota bacterium]MBC5826470.1 histidine ammonia-lyase [Candidatus Eremiobacteraeota bacterium]
MEPFAPVAIGCADLSLGDVVAVARRFIPAALDARAVPKIRAARDLVERTVATNDCIYGVTTGFGRLKNVRIPAAEAVALQQNLVRSHSAGVGEPLSEEVVRAGLLLRANSLARGNSGVRLELIELILELLNRRVTPVIPSQGSVGASGDLAPLAHMALVLMGEGEAWFRERRESGAMALERAQLRPLVLSYKEGLSLINGTQIMTGIGALVLERAANICKAADITAAMSLEAYLGTDAAFDERLNALRPHAGQARVAANLRHLLRDSGIMASHRGCDRVQDPYSFRCTHVVHGPVRDTLRFAANTVEIEMNSVTDNPIVFPEDGVFISGGNFHGEPVALAMDYLAIALSELGSIAERRIDKLLDGTQGMPPFLTERHGLCSGFMLAQYTAAALVSENKTLAFPASVDSIPTSAGQEDHVSMGTIGARQCAQVVANLENIIAIELLEAAQALDFRAPLACGQGTAAAYSLLRSRVPHLDGDRDLSVDIATARQLLSSGELVAAVQAEIGDL